MNPSTPSSVRSSSTQNVIEPPIVREKSQAWNIHVSFAEDGTIVEIVLLDAKQQGLLPVEYRKAAGLS